MFRGAEASWVGNLFGTQPEVREARLRPEFAALYPGLEPGAWQDAVALAEQMLTEHLLRPSPGYMLSERERVAEGHLPPCAGVGHGDGGR
jgi:hypothetical protein